MNFFGCMSSKTAPLEEVRTEALPKNCVASFNCQLSLETGRPWVCDVTFLSNGRIALLDKWNEKLKILDQKYSCKTSFSIKDAEALSSVSNDVIAVMASNTIVLYSIKGKLSDITVQETRFAGKGLAMACKDNYVVFLYENRDVYSSVYVKIMTVCNGGLSCHASVEIDMDANLSCYMAISDKMKRIFLGNIDQKTVMCFSTSSGTLLWETKMSSWPRGMVFVDNKILVATFFDHKIHCLNIKGEYLGVLFDSSSGIHYPLALCLHRPTQHLLVQCDHFGEFKVFEISALESLIKVEN